MSRVSVGVRSGARLALPDLRNDRMISFDRRAVICAASDVGRIWASPLRAAPSRTKHVPEFGSREAAIKMTERAVSEKYRQ